MSRAFLGAGLAFPFAPVDGRLQLAVHEDSVDQAVQRILLTGRGERVMLPEYGAGLRDRVFEPNTEGTWRDLESDVRAALVDWEPRIDLQEVRVETGDSPNVLWVHVAYVVRATNSFYNRVYPFYLTEDRG
ncbi:MAG: GPW/gp25 family protein [Myxococcales bacterium]|nr:GPW/gp25 family protein [Myxococcales bacterium]